MSVAYLEGVLGIDGSRVSEDYIGLPFSRVQHRDTPAVVTDDESLAVGSQTAELDARLQSRILLVSITPESRQRAEELAVGRVEQQPMAVGGRLPHNQPAAFPHQPLDVVSIGVPGALQLASDWAVDTDGVSAVDASKESQLPAIGPITYREAPRRGGGLVELRGGDLHGLRRGEVVDEQLDAKGREDQDFGVAGAELDVRRPAGARGRVLDGSFDGRAGNGLGVQVVRG